MVDAQKLSQISLGSMIFGGLLQGYGAISASRQLASSLEFQAEIGEINGRIADRAAQGAERRGRQQKAGVRTRGQQIKGAQRARLAANGIALDSDTAIELQTDTDYLTELDAEEIERAAVAEAWGYRTAATNQRNTALVSRGTAAGIDGAASGFNSLLGSAGAVASHWYDYKRTQ